MAPYCYSAGSVASSLPGGEPMRLSFSVFGCELWALGFDPEEPDVLEFIAVDDESGFGFRVPDNVE